jgi:Kelch motif
MRAADWGPIYYNTDFADTPANTLIEINMSTMQNEQWSNTTLPSEIIPRANAELVWLPVSDQGVLVAIGGVTNPEEIWPYGLNSSQEADSKAASPTFMTSLPVYDISSSQWYLQNSTGTPPGQLTEFCSVVAVANDSSSFNIYIYGGYDGLNAADLPTDDVWILSVPSFHWIKAYSGQSSHGRSGHRCVSPYPDQMFVVGGVHQSQASCVDGGIIQVFNLNSLNFQDSYDPATWASYQVPDIVSAVIGGDAQGGATNTASWTDGSLSKVFQTKYSGNITNYYPYPVASETTPNDNTSSSGSNNWLAPVLGIVLGLLVLGIIIFAIIFARRMKHLRRSNSVSNDSTSGSLNRYIRWVNGILPGPVHEEKSDPSSTSSKIPENPSHQSNPSNETNVTSPLASELGGHPRYEMSAAQPTQPDRPPVELPTPYHDQAYPRNIDYAYDRSTPGPKYISTPSASRSDGNHSSPFSPEDVTCDSGISHGAPSEASSSSNSPLLSPSRNSRAEDDVPPIPAIPRHMRQVPSMSSRVVSPLTPVDEGKARFNFD